MKKNLIAMAALMLACSATEAAEVKLKINRRYLNFPISHRMDRQRLTLSAKGTDTCRVVIRLAEEGADYWTFRDVSALKGKTIVLSYEGSQQALERVYQADTIMGESQIYTERNRPQYHFTTRRGWINDPNGLIYYQGKYHLYYQHNPVERDWENMHWGHAVSTDLLHWQEQPVALHPDTVGTIFSGSAVVDYKNVSGLGRKGEPALLAYYTAEHPRYQRQCMAYSLDGGQTFTKYAGNPIIDSHARWQSHDTRDPKVFWYAPGNHWVMVLNERDGHTIYTSTDMKTWEPTSHITGFWECPELFEVAVEGRPDQKKWVMWGASGTYMIGAFDGKRFTPDGPKLCNLNGSAYAAQVYNNIPAEDGRVIKIAWGRISFDDMPFNGCMLLPQEQLLRQTPSGLRLISRPIREVNELLTPAYSGQDLTMQQANEALRPFAADETLRIRAVLHLTYATDASLRFRGERLFDYDMNGNRLNGEFYAPDTPGSMDLEADIYVDRGMAEVFIDGGRYSYSMKRDTRRTDQAGYEIHGNQVEVKQLEVYRVKSVWNK